jgi:hypothetical protein
LTLPVYTEAEDRDRADAWLERDDQRIPLKRVLDDVDTVLLPGTPRTGAEAELARGLAERIEDVRIGVALLQGAAEKAGFTIDNSMPHIREARSIPSRAWAMSALAASEPLRRIVEGCSAFEDAIAAVEAARAAMPDESMQATIARVEAVRASMPSDSTLRAIETVEAVSASMPSLEVRKAINADALAKTHQPFSNL